MKRLHVCPIGNGGSKSTGFDVSLHQTLTWGHASEGCRIGLRGHRQGGKRRRGERSLVAAALSKIDAGVALLVREVGVALLLCFYSGRRDRCICCLCFAPCFHVVEIGRVSSIYNIRSVSTMTIADSAVCIFYWETKILFTGSSIFSFLTMRIAEKVDV